MSTATLTTDLKNKISALYPLYETRRSVIMPAFHLVQDTYGHISQDLVCELAAFMELPVVQLEEVLSFYMLYRRKPVGKHHFQICTNITCCMLESRKIRDSIRELTGTSRPEEVTPDGLFSYEEVPCLGSCGTAPVVMINEDYHENFSLDQAKHFIQKAKEATS